MPSQEPGVRPSRRLGYRFDVSFDADPRTLNLAIRNRGHFAGSPATKLRVEANSDPESARLRLRIAGGDDDHRDRRHRRPVVVEVADAYGRDRKVELHGVEEMTVDTGHSGGWYDLALTKPSDPTFGYQLAGRLESARRLTSDPQLGRS
jgi:hypothetical protein